MGGIGFCLKNAGPGIVSFVIIAGFVRKLKIYRQWVAMFYVGAGTLENGDMFFEHHYATHKKRLQEGIYFYFKR